MPKHSKKLGFWAVVPPSCFRQKEYGEEGRKCPNTAKSMDSGPLGPFLVLVRRSVMRRAGSAQTLQKARILGSSGARDPRQPMVPSRQGPDLAWDPFPGLSLNLGNLQTRPIVIKGEVQCISHLEYTLRD